jgi:hypothetical protein
VPTHAPAWPIKVSTARSQRCDARGAHRDLTTPVILDIAFLSALGRQAPTWPLKAARRGYQRRRKPKLNDQRSHGSDWNDLRLERATGHGACPIYELPSAACARYWPSGRPARTSTQNTGKGMKIVMSANTNSRRSGYHGNEQREISLAAG